MPSNLTKSNLFQADRVGSRVEEVFKAYDDNERGTHSSKETAEELIDYMARQGQGCSGEEMSLVKSRVQTIQEKNREYLKKEFLDGFKAGTSNTFKIYDNDVLELLTDLDSKTIEVIDKKVFSKCKLRASIATLAWFCSLIFMTGCLSGFFGTVLCAVAVLISVFSLGIIVLVPLALFIKGVLAIFNLRGADIIPSDPEFPLAVSIGYLANRNYLKRLYGDNYFPHDILKKN